MVLYLRRFLPALMLLVIMGLVYLFALAYIVVNRLFDAYMVFGSIVFLCDGIITYVVAPYIIFSRISGRVHGLHRLFILISIPWFVITTLSVLVIDTLVLMMTGEPTAVYPYMFPWSRENPEIIENYMTIPIPSIGSILSAIPVAYYTRYLFKRQYIKY